MGFLKTFKRILSTGNIVARELGTSPLAEAWRLYRLRKPNRLRWGDYLPFRFLGRDSFENQWIRENDYYRFALTINDKVHAPLLWDKVKCYERLEELISRPWMLVSQHDDEFCDFFCSSHSQLFIKPQEGARAIGAKRLTSLPNDTYERMALFESWRQQKMIVEQCLVPHPYLSAIFPESLSTLRIHTIRYRNKVRIPFRSSIAFGRKGYSVDLAPSHYRVYLNHMGHSLFSKAATGYQETEVASHHADTGASFENIQMPYWQATLELVRQAALKFPEIPYIAWDVAITATGPQIVEGNFLSGNIPGQQLMLFKMKWCMGMKRELEAMRTFSMTGEGAWDIWC